LLRFKKVKQQQNFPQRNSDKKLLLFFVALSNYRKKPCLSRVNSTDKIVKAIDEEIIRI